MAKIIRTAEDDLTALDGEQTYWLYNAFDSAITLEVFQKLAPQLERCAVPYHFVRAMQAPALSMMLRGLKVDKFRLSQMISKEEREINAIQEILDEFATAVWGQGLNPKSPKQVTEFFYTLLRVRIPSSDREEVEKLEAYFFARPFVKCILAIRDRQKRLGALRSGVDADGRMRTSYNIVGTETGRWSSSSNAFGSGDNLQNWTDALRRIFVADPGRKFAYIDLEQAESKVVAILIAIITGDWSYYRACRSGDLHTSVCKLIWDRIETKAQAEEIFYRHFTYRDMSKRGGHLTNYYGKPHTAASHLKIPINLAIQFQQKYLSAFPGMSKWHSWCSAQLTTRGWMTTLFGRTRYFLSRPREDSTLREAIAYEPQSVVGDALNLGLYKIWESEDRVPWRAMAQLHDAALIDYPEELEDELLPRAINLIAFSALLRPDEYLSCDLIIPAEGQVGWNWSKFNDKPAKGEVNLDGLRKYKRGDGGRKRSSTSLLHQALP